MTFTQAFFLIQPSRERLARFTQGEIASLNPQPTFDLLRSC